MLHKEVSQQLVATLAMPIFRSIVGQNAEHFLLIRWLRSLPEVGERENRKKSQVFCLVYFLQISVIDWLCNSQWGIRCSALNAVGFALGFVTLRHYLCVCDLWRPSPGLITPLLFSGPAECNLGQEFGDLMHLYSARLQDIVTTVPWDCSSHSTWPFPIPPPHEHMFELGDEARGLCREILSLPTSPIPECV